MKNKFINFILFLITFSTSQEFSYKGEFISSMKVSNTIPREFSSLESSFTFLPTLSIVKAVNDYSSIDFEYAFQIHRILNGSSTTFSKNTNYRFWLRYINRKSEIRIGLQKIIFGPSQILRSLSWFDNYNIKDPTSQTKGVTAARYKYFMSNSLNFTYWLIREQSNRVSLGSRMNFSSNTGEWALTFHRKVQNELQSLGHTGLTISDSHNRYALDYRFDGLIGFWFEGVVLDLPYKSLPYGTIGIDYTFNIFNGVHFLTETMIIDNIDKQYYSALLISKPLNFLHRIMLITQIDWKNELTYNFFQWNTSFDRFSINYILSINPKRSDYEYQIEDKSLDFGIGHKIMFIYNY